MDEQIKILFVDDEKNVLRSLERLFLDDDYEILTAASGTEGIDLLIKEGNVQIIISDYRMPEMNGVDFLKKVYENWPNTVRMVLSGYADASAIVGAINEGQIYKFMPKPWNDEELKVAITNAIDRYFMKQKNIELTNELEQKNIELQNMNNNLEKIIEKKTYDLRMHNKILSRSQTILNSLPIGVIGIDSEGSIVQFNSKATELMNKEKSNVLATDRQSSLSKEINDLIEKTIDKSAISSLIKINGNELMVKVTHMKDQDKQEGVIITLNDTGIDD